MEIYTAFYFLYTVFIMLYTAQYLSIAHCVHYKNKSNILIFLINLSNLMDFLKN